MAGVTLAPCQRCRRQFERTRPGQQGRPSPYCPPCREIRRVEKRKRRYNGAGQAERRQRTPKVHRAPYEPPTPKYRGRLCCCARPVPKSEGPLLVCGLCTREL